MSLAQVWSRVYVYELVEQGPNHRLAPHCVANGVSLVFKSNDVCVSGSKDQSVIRVDNVLSTDRK